MQTPRDPSMEDILASIKRVIAEEKELRAAVSPAMPEPEEDVLELDHPVEPEAPPVELGEPLLDTIAADSSRSRLAQLSSVAAAAPPPPSINPLEEMLRDMLRPVLKQWLTKLYQRHLDHNRMVEFEHILFRIGSGLRPRFGLRRRDGSAKPLLLRDDAFDRGENVLHRWVAWRLHRRSIAYRGCETKTCGCSCGVAVLVATGTWRGACAQSFQLPATMR